MTKKFNVLALIAVMVMFAGSLFAQDVSAAKAVKSQQKAVVLTPEKFQDAAEKMVGQEVEIEGMVIHVCKHGGKKMFLIGENPDIRIKITASDKVSIFDPELEGSTVHVTGLVEPMDEAEAVAKEEKHEEDADHKNYYHKPQFSISCLAVKTVED
jgi:RecJ-like exonuclease